MTRAVTVLCTLAVPGLAAAQADGALRSLQYATSHARTITDIVQQPEAAFVSGGAVAIETRGERTLVAVLVRVDGPGALDRLRALGGEIGGIAGDVASVRLPIEAVGALDDIDGIAAAQAARVLQLTPQADLSMAAIGADGVRGHGAAGWTGATGAGALVGVYDTGLDFRHADFIDRDGRTRIAAAWDQTAMSGNAPPAGYGHVCERAAIQQAIDVNPGACPMRDGHGHGTHVTGTAAGSGAANRAFDLGGVAPEAELLIVKGGDGFFSEAGIVDGLAWLRDRAQALGRPIVVNLSLSGQAGPHDGTRLFERAIDNLSGPGYIVVTVSSNDGDNLNTVPAPTDPRYIHARGLATTQPARFTLEIGTYSPVLECSANSVVLSTWSEAADSVAVTVVRPDGSRATATLGATTVDSSALGRVVIVNAPGGPDAQNGDTEAFVVVDGCGGSGPPASGEWAIELAPQAAAPSGAPMDLWLFTRFIINGPVIGRDGFDNRLIIGSPGSAHSAITVGAFVTRLCWFTPESSQVCYNQREELGDLARFSAGGPTRDGRRKPEITAPGLGIASSQSGSAGVSFLRAFRDNQHSVLEGTSMAAPHVAGTIALLLQYDPTLTPDGARALLAATARNDAFTARVYDDGPEADPADWWGAGKLDACAAVLAVTGEATNGLRISPASDSLPQGATLRLDTCAASGTGTIAWQSSNPAVATVDADGIVTALETGSTTIVGSSAAASASVEIVVVPPAILAFSTAPGPAIAPAHTRVDARIPLARLYVTSDGLEATDLAQVGVEVTGRDAAAWIILADANAAGGYDTTPPFAAAVQVALDGTLVVPLRLEEPRRIEQRDTAHYVVLLQTSGVVPNGTQFSVKVDEGATESVAVRSGARDRIDVSMASTPVVMESTLLPATAGLTFSENPVRHASVHFNFNGCPRRAVVHTLTGARVRDLESLVVCGEYGGNAEWDLTNDDGARVASGVYLVLFDLDGRVRRVKLMVLRPAGNGQEE